MPTPEKIKDFCRDHLAEIGIFILISLLYLPCLWLDFIWDDNRFILTNTHLSFSWENLIFFLKNVYCDLFTPFTFYSLMIDWNLFGLAPCGYHLHNVLLFSVSAVLAVMVLRRLGISPLIAFASVLLWGCGIQRVESVAWIAERKDVLCLFFMLLSILFFMQEYGQRKYPLVSAVFFIFSLLAKPASPGIFILFFVYAVWKEGSIRKVKWVSFIPAALLFTLYCIWFWLVSSQAVNGMPHASMNAMPRLIKVFFFNLVFYFSHGLFAFEANPHYPYMEWSTIPWGMFIPSVLILLVLCWFANKKEKGPVLLSILGWGVIWGGFFFTASGIFVFNSTDYADRYNLLPSLVIISMTAFFIQKCIQNLNFPKSIPVSILLIFSALSAYFTWNYIPNWKTFATLFRYSILSLPEGVFNQDRAYMNLGLAGVFFKEPELCQIASDQLMLKYAKILRGPLDSVRAREGRYVAACFFGQAAALLRKDVPGQIRYYNLLRSLPDCPWTDFNEPVELTDMYFLNFYFLLHSQKVPQNALNEFLEWQNQKSNELKAEKDPYLMGMLLIKRGKYAEALSIWERKKSKYLTDAQMQLSIRRLRDLIHGKKP